MDYNKVTKIEITIGSYFTCNFEAWKCLTDKGEIYREKSFSKNDDQLCYISLLQKFNCISLVCGNFQMNFHITEGNTTQLTDEYTVEYLGQTGTISVVELA